MGVEKSTRQIEAALIDLVRRTSDPRRNDYLAVRAGVDLERSAWTLLSRLDECQPARLSALAEICGLDVSTVSRQVGQLVDNEMIAQQPDQLDKRAKVLTLTNKGEDALAHIRKARWDWINEVLNEFDDHEREDLGALLTRFMAAVQQHSK